VEPTDALAGGGRRRDREHGKDLGMEKIRPELNLEKWVSIWSPARSNRNPKEKVIRREAVLPNGNKVWAEVEVGFTNKGELTTEDQKTYYALVKHWEENRRSPGNTYFSLRHLAKLLQRRWGTNVIQSLTHSLIRLRVTPFVWRNSYYDATSKQTIRVLDPFNILADLKIIQKAQDGVVNKEFGYFRFNDFILKNLLANHTKPLLLDTLLTLESDVAQLLYVYLDLIIADKYRYERRTKELFTDLGLEGTEYRKPSVRKRLLERAIAELRGRALTTGVISSVRLERTKDRKDYKVIFRKAPLPLEHVPSVVDGENTIRDITLASQAAQLVRYFHEQFHPTEEVKIENRELKFATELITEYGVQRARYIIDYTHKRAPETNYRPQYLSGIRAYVRRALAAYDDAQERKTAEAAAAACPLCDSNGYISFRESNGREFAAQCPHDLQKIQARMQREGLTRYL
jgi:hypothetical protein